MALVRLRCRIIPDCLSNAAFKKCFALIVVNFLIQIIGAFG